MDENIDKNIAKKIGADDLLPIDHNKTIIIIDQIKDQKLSKEEIERIIAVAPHVAAVAAEYFKTASEVARGAASSQKSAFDVISKIVDSLMDLSRHDNTPSNREKIADHLMQIANLVSDMNNSNNTSWGTIVKILGFVGGAVAVGLLGVRSSS